MWRPSLVSICPLCRYTASPAASRPRLAQTWIPNRRTFGSRGAPRTTPSRMVLSNRVAQRSRPDDASSRRARARPDGPFAGMNRTVANIDPAKERPAPTRRGGPTTSSRRDDKGRQFKALKMHKSLATVGYGHRTRIKQRIQQIESFDQFKLLPEVQKAVSGDVLKGMVDIKPTPVQRLAIPALLGQDDAEVKKSRAKPAPGSRQDFLLAAETGSGKTLAYMLPIINAMKVAESQNEGIAAYKERLKAEKERRSVPGYRGPKVFEPHPTTARPRIVVLVPTAELVDQVGAVATAISHEVKFKAQRLSANMSAKVIERNLFSTTGVDLVVTTPHLLAAIADSDPNVLSHVTHLVIDEADSLLDRSFSPVTTKILDRAKPSLQQLIFCSATIPKRLDNYIGEEYPDAHRITTPNLHAIPRRVQLGVIDVVKDPYRNNKNLACADAIWSIGKDAAKHEGQGEDGVDVKRIIVFVNEREKTQEVADFLKSKGIDAVALHRDNTEQRHSEMLASFTTREPLKVDREEASQAKGRRLPNTKVIVATDLASRGIDTLAVRHVVLYDVPHTSIDFIHRLGRAGRMGRRGRGIVLVGKDDRKDIVADVRESMFMGQALI